MIIASAWMLDINNNDKQTNEHTKKIVYNDA